MRARAFGLALLGLGAFALVAALLVPLLLVPAVVKLPLDQTSEPAATSRDVSYFDFGAGKQLTGLSATVRQHVVGNPADPAADSDVAVWTFVSAVNPDDPSLLSASKSSDQPVVLNAYGYTVCLDRRTAQAVSKCPSAKVDEDSSVTITGITLTFPFGTEKRSYDVFNPTTGKAFPARFQGVDTIRGTSVYRFVQQVPETVIQTTQAPASLVGSPGAGSVPAEIVYSNTRTMWVEPTSGVVVKAEESPFTVLRGPTGTRGATILAGTFTADDATIGRQLDTAATTRTQINLISTVVPWSLVALGVLALAAGALLLRRADRAAGPAEPEPWTGEPEPVGFRV